MSNEFTFTHPNVARDDLVVYNARNYPFRICGLYHPERSGLFRRMPQEVAESTSKHVHLLHTNTAGARLRFMTDSPYIAVGAIFPPMELPFPRTAALAGSCAFSFDVYANREHCRVLWPETLLQQGGGVGFQIPDGKYEAIINFPEKKDREITICFPCFANISDVYIGIQEGSALECGESYCNQNPVIFYGSSITQGACASRSGNIYQNILSRKLNFDYINLGFAGACRAENAIVDYLCTLDTPLLVFDYDHNAKSPAFLEKTHLPALRKFRATHPQTPIIVLSRPDRDAGVDDAMCRAEIIENNCRILQTESNAPVHFIHGQKIFLSHDKDMMTVDGTHPTDLGFHCMAEALYDVMKLYF